MLQCELYAKQGSVRNKQTRMSLTLLFNDSYDLKLYLLRRLHYVHSIYIPHRRKKYKTTLLL